MLTLFALANRNLSVIGTTVQKSQVILDLLPTPTWKLGVLCVPRKENALAEDKVG